MFFFRFFFLIGYYKILIRFPALQSMALLIVCLYVFSSFDMMLKEIVSLIPLSDLCFTSVQFSRSAVSNSLWPHESQHAKPPCPLPTPGVYPNSCLLSRWCHPAISSSVGPLSSCPQSLPASESFPVSQLFTWCGPSTGVSALTSFLPKKSQDWSSEWTGWILLVN